MTDIVPAGGYEAGLALNIGGRTAYARGTVSLDPTTGNAVANPGTSTTSPAYVTGTGTAGNPAAGVQTVQGAGDTGTTQNVRQTPGSYVLSSAPQTVPGNTYALVLPSAFNGATVTFTSTDANGVTGTVAYTARPATPPRFDIYAGTTVSVSVTGGTPTGNTVLAGGPTSGTVQNVQTPTPASVAAGQVKIATAGTPVQLPALALVNGIVVKLDPSATGKATIGGAGVTATTDGTGNGYILSPGEAASFAVSNANVLYVNGPAGAIFSYGGN